MFRESSTHQTLAMERLDMAIMILALLTRCVPLPGLAKELEENRTSLARTASSKAMCSSSKRIMTTLPFLMTMLMEA